MSRELIVACAAPSLSSDEINALFDEVAFRRGLREWAIFQQVYGETPRARRLMQIFLLDVRRCPMDVIEHCRALLSEYPKHTRPPR